MLLSLFLAASICDARQVICLGSYYYCPSGVDCKTRFDDNYDSNIMGAMKSEKVDIFFCVPYFSGDSINLKMSTFKNKDVLFNTIIQPGYQPNPAEFTLTLDISGDALASTAFEFANSTVTFSTSTSNTVLNLKDLKLVDSTINGANGWSLNTTNLAIPLDTFSSFKSVVFSGNLELILTSDTIVDCKEASVDINKKSISVTYPEKQSISFSTNPSLKSPVIIDLTSESPTAPLIIINADSIVTLHQFESKFSVNAPSKNVSLTMDTTDVPYNMTAKELNISLTNTTSEFSGTIKTKNLRLFTSNTEVTRATFNVIEGGIDIRSSLIDVEVEKLTQVSKLDDKSLQLIFAAGKKRISSIIVLGEFKSDIRSLDSLILRVDFDSYTSDSDIGSLIDGHFNIFHAPSFGNTNRLSVLYASDSPQVTGFTNGSSCLSASVDNTDGYNITITGQSPTKFQLKIICKTSNDINNVISKIPKMFKNILVSFQNPDKYGDDITGTIDLTNIDESNRPMNLTLINEERYTYGGASVTIKTTPQTVSNLTISSITISGSTIDVDSLYLIDATIDSDSTSTFGNSKVYSELSKFENGYKSYKFHEIVTSTRSTIDKLELAADKWKFASYDYIQYSQADKLTLYAKPDTTTSLTISSKSIRGMTWVTQGNLVLTEDGDLASTTVAGTIIIDHGSHSVQYTSNSVIDKKKIDFVGTGEVAIKYNFAVGGNLCCCESKNDCSSCSGTYVSFNDLNDTISLSKGKAFEVFIGASSSEKHPKISTMSLKMSTITFKGSSISSSFIEFDTTNIDNGEGTTTNFEMMTIVADNDVKFGILTMKGCDLKATSIEASTVNCSFENLQSLTSLNCQYLNLKGDLPTLSEKKSLDIKSAVCSMEFADSSSIITVSSSSVDVNKLNVTTTGKVKLSFSASTSTIIKAEESSASIKDINVLASKSVTFNFEGNFESITSGLITIEQDESCIFNLYSKNTRVSLTSSKGATFKACSSEVGITGYIKNDITRMITFLHDESIDSGKIEFTGGIEVNSRYSSSPFAHIGMPGVIVNFDSIICHESFGSQDLTFQFYIDLDGIGQVNVKNLNNCEISSTINIMTNVKEINESDLTFFDKSRVILTSDTDITSSMSISVSSVDNSQQAHGFNKKFFAFDVRIVNNKEIELYTKTNPKDIPVTMYYSSSSSSCNSEVCLKASDLDDITKFIPSWIKSASVEFSYISGELNLNHPELKDCKIYLKGSSSSYKITLKLGPLDFLSFDSVYYSISRQLSEGESIKMLHIKSGQPYDGTSTNIDFTKVDLINISTTSISDMKITNYQNQIIFYSTSSSGITYSDDGWKFSSYGDMISAADFPHATLEIYNSRLSFSIEDGTASIHNISINITYPRADVYFDEGWEEIEEKTTVSVAPWASITGVDTDSFYFPFILPTDIFPTISLSSSNYTLPGDYEIDDWKINVEPYKYGSKFSAVVGKNLIMSGTNTITVTNKKGGIVADDIVLNSQSDSTIGNLFVNKILNAKSGSKLHGTLNAASIELHWADDKFPFIEMASDSTQVPTEIKIIFDGTDSDGYESLVYGKTFSIINSNKCEELKSKSVFESSVDSFNGANSVLDVQCDGINLQVKGARNIKPNVIESSVKQEEIVIESSIKQNENAIESSIKQDEIVLESSEQVNENDVQFSSKQEINDQFSSQELKITSEAKTNHLKTETQLQSSINEEVIHQTSLITQQTSQKKEVESTSSQEKITETQNIPSITKQNLATETKKVEEISSINQNNHEQSSNKDIEATTNIIKTEAKSQKHTTETHQDITATNKHMTTQTKVSHNTKSMSEKKETETHHNKQTNEQVASSNIDEEINKTEIISNHSLMHGKVPNNNEENQGDGDQKSNDTKTGMIVGIVVAVVVVVLAAIAATILIIRKRNRVYFMSSDSNHLQSL